MTKGINMAAEYLIKLENHIENSLRIPIRWHRHLTSNAGQMANGISHGGRISMLKYGRSNQDKLATLLHEYYHEMYHKNGASSGKQRALVELEANTFACTVMQLLGFQVSFEQQIINGMHLGTLAGLKDGPPNRESMVEQHLGKFLLSLGQVFGYNNNELQDIVARPENSSFALVARMFR